MHGAVPRTPRGHVFDEVLGKKDDDGRPATPSGPARWNAAVPRFRKRRWLGLILALGFAYVFIKNIPTDLTPSAYRIDTRVPGRTINGMPLRKPPPASPPAQPSPTTLPVSPPIASPEKPNIPNPPKEPPPDKSLPKEPPIQEISFPNPPSQELKSQNSELPPGGIVGSRQDDNDEIEFPELYLSLQAHSESQLWSSQSSVLFLAGNTVNAAILIPMVCEMAKIARNSVNFAYFGRDNFKMSEIQQVNGVEGGCNATWHDARPENSIDSSDKRFEKAIASALDALFIYIQPEATFVVDSTHEEPQLANSVKNKGSETQKPIIEIPPKDVDKLMWLTRLEARSLAAWRHLDISVIIQVAKQDDGLLLRLLRSIQMADYVGHRYPHITLELPADLDQTTQNVVDSFFWPPIQTQESRRPNLSIRKRISSRQLTPLASSMRSVEAFWPLDPANEHVMLLSSNAELSPMWYHYLVFNVLEYMYSKRSASSAELETLAGISLITPLLDKDQEKPLKLPHWTPPVSWDPDLDPPTTEVPDSVPFLWQAPDATATLYFGNKWKELHSFLTMRLQAESGPTLRVLPPFKAPLEEPLNELMGLRGWRVLYPNLPAHQIASYEPRLLVREEFKHWKDDGSLTVNPDGRDTDPYESADYALQPKPRLKGDTKVPAATPIHNIIPNKGLLPQLKLLPILDNAGEVATAAELQDTSQGNTALFRLTHGGCPSEVRPLSRPLTADDLFCDESGTPFSGSLRNVEKAREQERQRQLEAMRALEEMRKATALGDALPIEGTANGEGQAQIQQEFKYHMQRQRLGATQAASTTPIKDGDTTKPNEKPSDIKSKNDDFLVSNKDTAAPKLESVLEPELKKIPNR